MKFNLLSLGQKFKYKDETYIKTSPLIASNVKTSQNKMIPRYAILTLLDESGIEKQQINQKNINALKVNDAFNLFYAKCIATLEKNDVLVPLIKDELDKSRDEFVQSLK